MPAPSTFKVAKVARYLIPFVKPITLGLIDPKDETIKELADAGLDFLGDEAKEKIKDYLTKEPDAATGLLDEHLVRHSGAVLGKLVKCYAKEAAPKDHRADLLKIAKATPEGWSEFLQSGGLEMEPLRKDALQRRLTAALDSRGKMPELEPATFVEFFRWLAQQKELLGPLRAGLTPPLTKWIIKHLDQQLLTDLCRDTTEGKAACKESLLRFHAMAQRKLNVALGILHKHGDSLERIEQKLGEQASREDISAVKTRVELGFGELKKLWTEFDKTSPLHLYRDVLKEEYHFIEVITLDTADDPKVREAIAEHGIVLREAYVEPPCAESYQHPEDFDAAVTAGETPWKPFMAQLAKHRRIVLVADPGMGKSTLIRSLLHSIASKRVPAEAGADLACCVPFPLILRNLVPMLLELQPDSSKWRWADLLEVFQSWRPGNATRPLLEPFTVSAQHRASLQQLFESPLAYFLIDGLDEVGSVALRRDIQCVILEGYRLSHPQSRFLITSRVIGYDAAPVHVSYASFPRCSPPVPLPGQRLHERTGYKGVSLGWELEVPHAQLLYLSPFTDGHQREFAQYWFGKRFSRGGAEGSTQRFIAAAHAHDSVRLIGRNPYILLLLVFVYQDKHELPDGRTKIYDRVAELYLKVLDDKARVSSRLGPIARCTADQKKRWLQLIAMHMQMRRTQATVRSSASKETAGRETHAATGEEIAGWLAGHIDRNGYLSDQDAARAFVEYLGERTGLLVPRGQDHFEWHHNSFMEFFAALYIREQLFVADQLRLAGYDYNAPRATLEAYGLPPESLPGPLPVRHAELARWAGDERWREVLIFLMEYMAGPGKAVELQRHLKGIFPGLHAHGSADPERTIPLLPLPAVDLAVRLANDSHLDLPEPLRQSWWQRLWSAYLDWPHPPWESQAGKNWPIAPLLLGSLMDRKESLEQLAMVYPKLRKTRSTTSAPPIRLYHCSHLTDADMLPIAELVCLEYLNLEGCTKLERLPELRALHALHTLNLRFCTGLHGSEALFGLSELAGLQRLELYGCTKLESLGDVSGLRSLRQLDLGGCVGLRGPDALRGLANLAKLKELDLQGCSGLESLPDLRELQKLRWLRLLDCTGLRSPEALSGLTKLGGLETLILSGCIGLESLPDLSGLRSLRELSLGGCHGLKDLVELKKQFHPECRILGPDGEPL